MAANPKFTKMTSRLEAVEAEPAPEERQRRIATAAYYKAEARGFLPDHEFEDWLEAEREIDGDSGGDPSLARREEQGR